jgi:hypothetical protein
MNQSGKAFTAHALGCCARWLAQVASQNPASARFFCESDLGHIISIGTVPQLTPWFLEGEMVKIAVLVALLSALGAAATMRPTVPPPPHHFTSPYGADDLLARP